MQAGRPTELRNPKTVPIVFEKAELEEFQEMHKGKKLSPLIRDLVKNELIESPKKVNPPSIAILSGGGRGRDTTLNEYTVPNINAPPQETYRYLKNLKRDQLTKVSINVMNMNNQIRNIRAGH